MKTTDNATPTSPADENGKKSLTKSFLPYFLEFPLYKILIPLILSGLIE